MSEIKSEITTDIFKFLSVRSPKAADPKQNWNLFYRDQKVYFGSNTPPVIERVENCLITDIKLRNEEIKNSIEENIENTILNPRVFIERYHPIAGNELFLWLQTNSHKCDINDLMTKVKTLSGKDNREFIDSYYQISNKKELWDTLYAEKIYPTKITKDTPQVERYFRERVEATIVICEIMERNDTLSHTDFLHKILDIVNFIFPMYLFPQKEYSEIIASSGTTREDKIAELEELRLALKKINNEIRLEDLKKKLIGRFDEATLEIHNSNDNDASM